MQTRNLIASFALGITLTATPLVSVNAQKAQTPNLYQLQGKNIYVTYSTSSISGKPLFTYQDQQQTLNFEGDEIRTSELEIGTLVTVTILRTVDTGSTTFSLLLPRVNLGQDNQATIVTQGITTRNRFSVFPEAKLGQTQLYKTIPLVGTAQAVAF